MLNNSRPIVFLGNLDNNSNGYGIKASNGAEVILGPNLWFENLNVAIQGRYNASISDSESH